MKTYSTSERTKQALIHAAGELLAESEVGRVSTRAIAERAGVNLGTIHYHFGGKEELFKEVLRFACPANEGDALRALIEDSKQHLDTPEGQLEAVARLVRHFMRTIFSPARPRWCSRVIYQSLQRTGPLCAFLRDQMVKPSFATMTDLALCLRPDWTSDAVYLWINMVIGPMVFHSDHREIVMDLLGSDGYPETYLESLEWRITRDAAWAIGVSPGLVAAAERRLFCRQAGDPGERDPR